MKTSPTLPAKMVGLIALVAVLAGCVAQAAEHREVPADDDLLDGATLVDGTWSSAPIVRARWIPYPARATVTVAHGLGRIPTSVEVYLSSDPDDSKADHTRNSFQGAGNIVTITDVDEDSVSLNNNTAGDYYLRLVVR